ncbi:MAG: hypothetical protein NXY57DRAFT_411662, partial [Lentinula lateritia]
MIKPLKIYHNYFSTIQFHGLCVYLLNHLCLRLPSHKSLKSLDYEVNFLVWISDYSYFFFCIQSLIVCSCRNE